MSFIFKFCAVADLAGICTVTKIVILRWRRPRSRPSMRGGDDIVDIDLLRDFFDAQVKGVRFNLLGCHGRG